MGICKSLNISIGTVVENPEMLKFVSYHLKTKKIDKHAVKKLPYLLRYVADQHKAQQMCEKAILWNSGTLKSVFDWYKNQEMCNEAVDNYCHALVFDMFIITSLVLYCRDKSQVYINNYSLQNVRWSCYWFYNSIETYSWLVCYKQSD